VDESTRAAAATFDAIAAEYDAHRPPYPDALVDLGCRRAGLGPGSQVLEIGCGTGQLTASLLARGVHVTAIEPGAQLAAIARSKLDDGSGAFSVRLSRLEDAELPAGAFAAVFSAAAFHWVDPDLGWSRVRELLAPGGTFALMQHVSVDDPARGPDADVVLDAIGHCAPEWAARWPATRTRAQTLAGAEARRGNLSELWSFLGGYDLARPHAGPLFADAVIDTELIVLESTATDLNALIRTMSFHARLSAEQAGAIDAAILAHERRVGRPLRAAELAVLVTARACG
jgi:SAM-dependent methyltransferase